MATRHLTKICPTGFLVDSHFVEEVLALEPNLKYDVRSVLPVLSLCTISSALI